jgi:hypothetical protein
MSSRLDARTLAAITAIPNFVTEFSCPTTRLSLFLSSGGAGSLSVSMYFPTR